MEKYLASVKKSEAGGSEMNPSTTKGTALAASKRREELNKRRAAEEKKLKEEADRVAAQNKLKGTV